MVKLFTNVRNQLAEDSTIYFDMMIAGTHAIYYKPITFSRFPNLIAAESTRHGGVSPAPFLSLNLGINTADAPENVDENRRRFFEAIGATTNQFASSHQVHGSDILYTAKPGCFEGYDALITDQPGLLVGVTVADCVPILIYDQTNKAVAAIHAGWRGTVGKIVAKTLTAMQRQFSTDPAGCYVYIGTCIDQWSFEVGPEVAEQFDSSLKHSDLHSGKSYVDLKAANLQVLIDSGVPFSQIEISSCSTVMNNDDYFSYRAEGGQTGRMLVVAGLKS